MADASETIYELLVKRLLETRLRRDGLGDLKSFHLGKYTGASGQKHEIDVTFEVSIGNLKLLFLVECKHYTRAVDDVMAFAFRLRDIGAHKGLIVSTVPRL